MYTLRIFKDYLKVERTQISLGESYTVTEACPEDEKLNIKYRITAEGSNVPNDGLCVFNDDYAFIMTESGKTFEVLNRPS